MTKEEIISRIDNFIYENHDQNITGDVLNDILHGTVDYAEDAGGEASVGMIIPSTSVITTKEDGVVPSSIDLSLLIPSVNQGTLLPSVPEGYKVSVKVGSAIERYINTGGSLSGISLSGLQESETFVAKLWKKLDGGESKLVNSISIVANSLDDLRGENGQYFMLLPLVEKLQVEITSYDNYESLVSVLGALMQYAVVHVDGNEYSYLKDLTGYKLSCQIDMYTKGDGVFASDKTGNYRIPIQTDSANTYGLGAGTKYFNLSKANILTDTQQSQSEAGVSYNPHNYYELLKNNPSYVPTNIVATLTYNGDVVDRRRIDVVFNTEHIFYGLDSALNSVYQGLTGSEGAYTALGLSRIYQNWQNISLSVSNVESYRTGDIPLNSETENYCFKVVTSTSVPETPEIPEQTDWYVEPTGWRFYAQGNYPTLAVNQYVFISSRKREGNFNATTGEWQWEEENPAWGTPTLFDKYGVGRGAVNSAMLDIKADQIQSTVAANYIPIGGMDGYVTQSQLTQTADGINSSVAATYQRKEDMSTYATHSEINQTASGITSMVAETYQTLDGMSEYVTQSELIQTASGITLDVKSDIEGELATTGIDIASGKITLNADNTDIVGNLNVTGNDSYFQFVDDYGNIKFTMGNTPIESEEDFTGNNQSKWVPYFGATYGVSSGTSDIISIGQWHTGTVKVSQRSFFGTCKTPTGGGQITLYHPNVKYTITPIVMKKSGNEYIVVHTGSSVTTSFVSGQAVTPVGGVNFSYTTDEGITNQELFMKFNWSMSDAVLQADQRHEMSLSIKYTSNVVNAHTYIAYNGFGFKYLIGVYTYSNVNGTTFSYPNYGYLKIDSSGTHIKKYVEQPVYAHLMMYYPGVYYITQANTNRLYINKDGGDCTGEEWKCIIMRTTGVEFWSSRMCKYKWYINGTYNELNRDSDSDLKLFNVPGSSEVTVTWGGDSWFIYVKSLL